MTIQPLIKQAAVHVVNAQAILTEAQIETCGSLDMVAILTFVRLSHAPQGDYRNVHVRTEDGDFLIIDPLGAVKIGDKTDGNHEFALSGMETDDDRPSQPLHADRAGSLYTQDPDPLGGLDPIEHAKQVCAECGHVRHAHNQAKGACNSCDCTGFRAERKESPAKGDWRETLLAAMHRRIIRARWCLQSGDDNGAFNALYLSRTQEGALERVKERVEGRQTTPIVGLTDVPIPKNVADLYKARLFGPEGASLMIIGENIWVRLDELIKHVWVKRQSVEAVTYLRNLCDALGDAGEHEELRAQLMESDRLA